METLENQTKISVTWVVIDAGRPSRGFGHARYAIPTAKRRKQAFTFAKIGAIPRGQGAKG